jgi:hypothetical protein
MERSVFGLPASPTQRYRQCIYSMIYLPAGSAVAREVAGSAERWVLPQVLGGPPRPGGPSSFSKCRSRRRAGTIFAPIAGSSIFRPSRNASGSAVRDRNLPNCDFQKDLVEALSERTSSAPILTKPQRPALRSTSRRPRVAGSQSARRLISSRAARRKCSPRGISAFEMVAEMYVLWRR